MCTIKYGGFVVPGRVELPTSTLSVWRSNQLGYRTVVAGTPGHHQIFFEKDSRESVQDTGGDPYPFTTEERYIKCPEKDVCTSSPERRCSSRTFRYGYLVTT